MKNLKIEIFVTDNTNQMSFELQGKPLMLGLNSSCQIKLGDSGSPIKAIIQREDSSVRVKVLDPNYCVEYNGEEHSSIVITEGSYFKIAHLDIVINIETSEPKLPEAPQVLAENDEKSPPPQVPVSAKKESEVASSSTRDSSVEVFNFSTVFTEENAEIVQPDSLETVQFNTDLYIDPTDETVSELPSEDIEIESLDYSVEVKHQHNGVLLSHSYVSLSNDTIYLSNLKEGSNTIKIHDCELKKIKVIAREGDKHQVFPVEGYEIIIKNEQGIQSLDSMTPVMLEENSTVILKKGLSQVSFRISPSPNLIRRQPIFAVNEELTKKVASTWAVIFIPLLLIFLFASAPTEKVEPKKEMVVIYKRKKVTKEEPVPKKDPVPSESEAAAAQAAAPSEPVAQEVLKKEVSVKKVVEKETVTKKQPKKVVEKRQASKKRKSPKRRSQKKAVVKANTAPPKPEKKSYSFSSSKKMDALLGAKDVSFKKANLANADASFVKGSSNSLNQNFNKKSFGRTGINAGSIAQGRMNGSSLDSSSKGLSGKSTTSTAYQVARTKVLGAIDPELIRKIMREYIPQFRYCYQRELAKNENVAGVFDVSFKINAVGKGVKTTTNAKGFTPAGVNCIKKVISMITFPKPKGGGTVDVKQPMNFYKL